MTFLDCHPHHGNMKQNLYVSNAQISTTRKGVLRERGWQSVATEDFIHRALCPHPHTELDASGILWQM